VSARFDKLRVTGNTSPCQRMPTEIRATVGLCALHA
jgi:hypothetical protein